MAHKSTSQRARASARRAARKEQRAREEEQAQLAAENPQSQEPEKKGLREKLFKSNDDAPKDAAEGSKAPVKQADKPVKKNRFAFLKEVRSELKRVTWPTRQDVIRWSGVVVVALLFFGLYVALLDNVIVTPLLVAVSGLGA